MPDDLTLGEIGRRLDDRISDVRDDIAQLGRRIESKVDAELYRVQYDALRDRVTALEAQRVHDATRVAATRRWLVGAVIVPIVAALLAYLLSMGGKA